MKSVRAAFRGCALYWPAGARSFATLPRPSRRAVLAVPLSTRPRPIRAICILLLRWVARHVPRCLLGRHRAHCLAQTCSLPWHCGFCGCMVLASVRCRTQRPWPKPRQTCTGRVGVARAGQRASAGRGFGAADPTGTRVWRTGLRRCAGQAVARASTAARPAGVRQRTDGCVQRSQYGLARDSDQCAALDQATAARPASRHRSRASLSPRLLRRP